VTHSHRGPLPRRLKESLPISSGDAVADRARAGAPDAQRVERSIGRAGRNKPGTTSVENLTMDFYVEHFFLKFIYVKQEPRHSDPIAG
jgi:hypothetical protein